MKLTVRVIQVGRFRKIALCDEGGNPLPGQRSVAIHNEVNDVATVTVQFVVDGDDVRLALSD